MNVEHPEYDKALEELTQAEKATPADADVFYLRGKIYLATNHNEDAAAALRRLIQRSGPWIPDPITSWGRLYQKLGKPELAKETFDRLKYLEEAARSSRVEEK